MFLFFILFSKNNLNNEKLNQIMKTFYLDFLNISLGRGHFHEKHPKNLNFLFCLMYHEVFFAFLYIKKENRTLKLIRSYS